MKYRIWDKTTEEMSFIDTATGLGTPADLTETENRVVMEWTGLHDQGGTDVYEDDVLDFDTAAWGATGFRSRVQADDNGQWDFGGGTAEDVSLHRTVLGNVWQEPDILTRTHE